MNDIHGALAAVLACPPDEQEEFARQLPILLQRLPAQIAALITSHFLRPLTRAAVHDGVSLMHLVAANTLSAIRTEAQTLRELLQPPHAAD
jgi:hypothetical protein